jgi:EAL domain-containing protein (putative c-di-GMP-specific phosphodiesterase class I)
MARLRAAGVQISIDDFGTGYSSLNYLSELPVDVLKIDGSFVRRLGQAAVPGRASIIPELIIEMAHRLDLHVIAEVVETADQLNELRRMGCDVGQGYYFNRPLHSDQVATLLQRRASSEELELAA